MADETTRQCDRLRPVPTGNTLPDACPPGEIVVCRYRTLSSAAMKYFRNIPELGKPKTSILENLVNRQKLHDLC